MSDRGTGWVLDAKEGTGGGGGAEEVANDEQCNICDEIDDLRPKDVLIEGKTAEAELGLRSEAGADQGG